MNDIDGILHQDFPDSRVAYLPQREPQTDLRCSLEERVKGLVEMTMVLDETVTFRIWEILR